MENPAEGQEFAQNFAPEPQTPEQSKAELKWEVLNRLAENGDVAQLEKSYQQLKNLDEAL